MEYKSKYIITVNKKNLNNNKTSYNNWIRLIKIFLSDYVIFINSNFTTKNFKCYINKAGLAKSFFYNWIEKHTLKNIHIK